jgi:ATP-binding cassette subfamily F protein uup
MPVLDATELSRTLAGRPILDRVTLTIRRGEKVGLVGRNGSGKSTLGRVLAGLDDVDGGRIARRRGARVAYLEQEPRFEAGRSVRDVVLESLGAWSEARQRYEALADALASAVEEADQARLSEAMAEAADALERAGGWEREHEAEATIGHLGIDDSSRLVETLSGGEARRVALARLLVASPDLAILDEPTNHLDLATIEWLETHLSEQFDGAVLLISHDRHVLDAVTTRTLEIHDGAVESYDGGYAEYLTRKSEREALAERTWRNTQNFLRREVEWLRRMPKARGTKQKARIQRAEEALGQRAPRAEQQADLRATAERQGKTILELNGLSIERGDRRLVDGLHLALRPGDRLGIVGPNGSGKTSLLLALLGRLEPTEGEVVRGATTKIGYLDQARSDLDPHATVREAAVGDAGEVVVGEERLSVGSYLERFLFDHAMQRVKVGELSGGERARVCLARLLAQSSNLLILDEPTNDLDVMTLSALEAMLLDFGGSLLLVSHDRWLLDRVTTGILAFEGDGRVERYTGNFSDYRERAPRPTSTGGPKRPVPEEAPEPKRSAPAPARKLTHAERRELDGMPDAIEASESRVAALQDRLSDPETYQGDGESVAALRVELANAEDEVLRLTERWEELESLQARSESR